MGGVLFKLLVHPDTYGSRILKRFKEVNANAVAVGDSPQLISGAVTSQEELVAPLSGKKCVYYKIETLELCDVNDKVDWHPRFVEEKAVSFGIGGQVYVNAANKSSPLINYCSAINMEIHTGEESFPAAEFGEEPETVVERVMVFDGTVPNGGPVTYEGIPAGLHELLTRNEFDIYETQGEIKHKRMKFIEKCILANTEAKFIGIVKDYNAQTSLGTRKYKIEGVDTTTRLSGWSEWDLLCWKEIVKVTGIIVVK